MTNKGSSLFAKHTIDIPPGTKRSSRVRADALGRGAFHCHCVSPPLESSEFAALSNARASLRDLLPRESKATSVASLI